jgi:hypothetical protein
MDRSTLDLLVSIGVLCGTSAIATNSFTLPAFIASTASGAVLLVAGLLVSTVMPMTGISLLILAIILFFRRNMNHTVQGTLRLFESERANAPNSTIYGESTIPLDRQGPQTPGYDSTQLESRTYTQNLGPLDAPGLGNQSMQGLDLRAMHSIDSDIMNRTQDSVVDSYFRQGVDSTIVRAVEGFVPATIEESSELNPPKGQYQTEESRETATPVTESYLYRPAADTGTNDFQRYGPQMDKKVDSFRYYA